jgi:hypothetical protein
VLTVNTWTHAHNLKINCLFAKSGNRLEFERQVFA